MAEYIDREAVIEYLKNLPPKGYENSILGKITLHEISNFPTADVVEVRHGEWVMVKPRVRGRNATYKCTCCGKYFSSYYNDVQTWRYCPCGAKMDGKGEGE